MKINKNPITKKIHNKNATAHKILAPCFLCVNHQMKKNNLTYDHLFLQYSVISNRVQ